MFWLVLLYLGHYMAFETNARVDKIAHLESEVMEPESQGCLEFWYYMNMWSSGEHLRRQFSLWNIVGFEQQLLVKWHDFVLEPTPIWGSINTMIFIHCIFCFCCCRQAQTISLCKWVRFSALPVESNWQSEQCVAQSHYRLQINWTTPGERLMHMSHHQILDSSWLKLHCLQIVFEAMHRYLDGGVIGLDDIYIRRNTRCSDLTATTPAPTTEPTSPPASSMDCNFEEGKRWMSKI